MVHNKLVTVCQNLSLVEGKWFETLRYWASVSVALLIAVSRTRGDCLGQLWHYPGDRKEGCWRREEPWGTGGGIENVAGHRGVGWGPGVAGGAIAGGV